MVRGHLTIKCYKNPDRKQAYSAEVGVGDSGYGGSKGSNSVPKEEAQGMQSKSDNMASKGNSSSRVVVISAGVDEVMINAIIS